MKLHSYAVLRYHQFEIQPRKDVNLPLVYARFSPRLNPSIFLKYEDEEESIPEGPAGISLGVFSQFQVIHRKQSLGFYYLTDCSVEFGIVRPYYSTIGNYWPCYCSEYAT